MVSMVDATFFIIIYQLHEVSGIESMIKEYKPSVIIVLNTSKKFSFSQKPGKRGGGGKSISIVIFPLPHSELLSP